MESLKGIGNGPFILSFFFFFFIFLFFFHFFFPFGVKSKKGISAVVDFTTLFFSSPFSFSFSSLLVVKSDLCEPIIQLSILQLLSFFFCFFLLSFSFFPP